MPKPSKSRPPSARQAEASLNRGLAPLVAVMFVIFFVIGMAMPVLPLHVHGRLGQGAFIVGLVAGSQFSASLISRFWAGGQADSRGGKRAIIIGLIVAACAGLIYLLSLSLIGAPAQSVAVIIVGRGVLGGAESFVIAGLMSWGLTLGGVQNASKVIAWMGTAMYAAFAIGAPAGAALYAAQGFGGVALATVTAPLLALLIIAPHPGPAPSPQGAPALRTVLKSVAAPGLGLALSSVGFGAITIFITLHFAQHGWSGAWIAFTALSAAFILARLTLGSLPDKIGGAKVALISVLVEAVGQATIWLAHGPRLALVGAALTGLGYSLVFPAFGVEAVKGADPKRRGLIMGAYAACLDLALGVGGPALGLVAKHTGSGSVFLASTLAVLGSAAVAGFMTLGAVQRRM